MIGPFKRVWTSLLTLTSTLCGLFRSSYEKGKSVDSIKDHESHPTDYDCDSDIRGNSADSLDGFETDPLDHDCERDHCETSSDDSESSCFSDGESNHDGSEEEFFESVENEE